MLCLDVEPSERQLTPDAPPRWRGWDLAADWVDDLRPVVQAVTGRPLNVSWFVRTDPQVAEVFGSAAHPFDAHPDLVERARAAGDAFGVHVHSWRATADGDWVEDQADADWVDHCVDVAMTGFRDGVGAPCELTRMGDRFMSDRVTAHLDRHRVKLDLSVEPGWSPVPACDRPGRTADLPDYRRVPQRPYRPALADFRREARRSSDGRSLVLLPLASAPLRRADDLRSRLADIRRRGWRAHRTQPIGLSRMGIDRTTADRVAAAALDTGPGTPLAFAIRTQWDLDPDDRTRIDRAIGALLDHPDAGTHPWITAPEAVDPLTG